MNRRIYKKGNSKLDNIHDQTKRAAGADGFFVMVIPVTFLLAGKGGEIPEFVSANSFYLSIAAVSLFMIVALRAIEIIKGKKSVFFTYIWDPENAIPPFNKVRFWDLMKASILIFTAMGFSAAYFNTVFFGLPKVQFQVSNLTTWVLQTDPAASSETLLFLVVMSILASFIYWVAKQTIGKGISRQAIKPVLLILLTVAMGLIVVSYHNLVYSGDEAGKIAVFFLGAGGAAITVITGSVIPWYFFHAANNFFVSLNPYFSNEAILLWAIVVLFAEFALFFGKNVYNLAVKGRWRS